MLDQVGQHLADRDDEVVGLSTWEAKQQQQASLDLTPDCAEVGKVETRRVEHCSNAAER